MKFINSDFMLNSKTAKHLFESYAEDLPIIDYHCHLDPKLIAENKQFSSVTEIMLGGDHYKWRAMRSFGIDENYITGTADDREKFREYAKMLTYAIGNPLFHWTHLELSRYFGIDEVLSEKSCDRIFDKCNEMLKSSEFLPQNLIRRSNVEVLCTTDMPYDTLEQHKLLAKSDLGYKVLPTFRPDAAIEIGLPGFKQYIDKCSIKTYSDLLDKLTEQIEYFNSVGCRLSDHGMEAVPFALGNAEKVFEKALNGAELTQHEIDIYRTDVIVHCAKQYSRLGWAMQMHIGAMRNNNTPLFNAHGPDCGCDSVGNSAPAYALSRLLDRIECDSGLPRTILYSLDPKDYYILGTMIGNFQKSPVRGKLQLGSGWWFNDHHDGMKYQLKTLAALGILGTFVGMLTDSRSIISYPRHEYFRRILCDLIGRWVENGEYPNDESSLKKIVSGICYYNAKNYFNF